MEPTGSAVRRKQPRGLYVLFMTEMWERFGFYTMFSLFVLYLTQEVGLSDDDATLLYGTFASFIYMATLPGGFLADRLLGFRRAIVMGACIMSVGYVSLLVSTPATVTYSLALLIVGNGLFKPNVGSLLGQLYDEDDPRRESGFTIFYLGINTGAFIATLIAGWIGQTFGYNVAFAIAGVGKVISLIVFLSGQRWLENKGHPPRPEVMRKRFGGLTPTMLVLVGGAGIAFVTAFLMRHEALAGELLALIAAGALALMIREAWREDIRIRRRLIAFIILTLSSVVFWTVYNQVGTSFILFTERLVDRTILGTEIPPSEFTSLNPFFILAMGGPFALLWAWLARRGRNPSIPLKFVLGHLLLGAAFFTLVMGISSADGKVPWEWLVLFFALYTAAEMTLSPVGLAMTTALAPPRLTGLAMGLWLLGTSAAYYLAGLAAGIASVPDNATDAESASIYGTAFADYGGLAIGGGLVLLALVPWVRNLMGRVEVDENTASPHP